ncbi:MAG: type II toxin-antitoxin system Phd/YefM family antitoxin [Firmicutes bacterium]|nr:type II toxin-antitoxin system Phd/YefM family antitoxin [Bacillota bacterium]
MSSISATKLQKDLFMYLDKAIDENEVLNVSTQKGNVIILSAEIYQRQMSEMERLEELEAIRRSEEDFENGRVCTHEEVFGRLRAKAQRLMDGVNV